VLAHTGRIDRFPATTTASATPASPSRSPRGEHSRHRLSRTGNRQLNCTVHLIALQ
jgi:hypothetical protein